MKVRHSAVSFRGLLFVLLFVAAGCASAPTADIPSTAVPQDEITKLDQNLKNARHDQIDVLAPKEFHASEKWLDEARSDSAANKSQEDILNDLRKGQGYLNRAISTGQNRSGSAQTVLKARQDALAAGARDYPATNDKLKKIDDELAGNSKKLGDMSPEDITKLQSKYIQLQSESLQASQLGRARATVNWAKKEDAASKAPSSLKQAEVDLKGAENVIAANSQNPSAYSDAVSKANHSAAMLKSVLETVQANKGLKEGAAIQMVNQKNQIAELNEDVERRKSTETSLSNELAEKTTALSEADKSVRMQEAIDSARKEFSKKDAEVYQEGDKLVVRLKTMQFPTGRADLPAHSLNLLSKVKSVAEELKSDKLEIVGHTDSRGGAKLNEKLSQKRADTVASYFTANGYDADQIDAHGMGYEKPLASNKSKRGRAENRRVDVIITPGETAVQ